MRLSPFGVVALHCMCLVAAASVYRIQVFPEMRIGPITKSTTRAELDRLFGKEAVTDGNVYVGEGDFVPGTFVYKNDPSRVLAITWSGPSADARPSSVRICGELNSEPCHWRTGSGVTIGTTLQELERLNGRPFRLSGFAWDYEGTVLSWAGGRFQTYSGDCDRLLLRLRVDAHTRQAAQSEWRQLQGDRGFSSGHPAMQRLNPRVYSMQVEFDSLSAPGCTPPR